ncbi:hypothetical protein JHK85_043980 [Glycine max]|nr:hypothetical protein JHK85_043980 [Glycine max]
MLWPFKVVAGINDKPMIVVKYKGQEKHLCAEENVVVTVPAYFNDSQRKATIAAIAYGLDKRTNCVHHCSKEFSKVQDAHNLKRIEVATYLNECSQDMREV